jgi:putative ABC transport system substrate-binding protein
VAARGARAAGGQAARIGIIDNSAIWDYFRQGLRELGYIEGGNVAFEYRSAEGNPERLVAGATELARRPVDVIATYGTAATSAAKQATTTIPIVMMGIGDPIRSGLVASLAHPGGNVTGNTILGPEISAKRLQLFKEVLPTISRVAFLWNPNNASHATYLEEWKAAASALGVTMQFVAVGSSNEFDCALAAMMRERPDGFTMTADPSISSISLGSSTSWQRTGCLGCSKSERMWWSEVLCPTAPAYPTCFGAEPRTWIRFCEAPAPPNCPWNNRSSST